VNRLLIITLAAALALSGCVGKSTYEKKVVEADQLSAALNQLAQDYSKLKNNYEDLKSNNDALEADFQRAQKDIERLEKVLSARSIEAGEAMAEMRLEIDRLEAENRELELAVESERIARQARIAQMKSTYDELVNKMEAEIERGEITISELQGELTVNMVNKILFPSGSATIKKEGLKVLEKVGEVVKNVKDKNIHVEGHTDNVPISGRLTEKFPTNWELSTARATSVVRFLRTLDIPGERLAAVGYGQFQPIADNDTAEGRAENRRIQIILVKARDRFKKPL
jgi:chemotaxis protein MotB